MAELISTDSKQTTEMYCIRFNTEAVILNFPNAVTT